MMHEPNKTAANKLVEIRQLRERGAVRFQWLMLRPLRASVSDLAIQSALAAREFDRRQKPA